MAPHYILQMIMNYELEFSKNSSFYLNMTASQLGD